MRERYPPDSLCPQSQGCLRGGQVGAMMMNKYMVEKWERERQNSLYAVVRGRLEEARAVRNVLMLASLLATWNQGDKWAVILP